MVFEGRSTDVTIGGWPLRQFGRLATALTVVVGLVAIVFIIARLERIYLWTLLLVFYISLGLRAARRDGREVHFATLGWLTGAPLGFVLALAELVVYRETLYLLNVIRLPILVSLFGVVVVSATGFFRRRRLTLKHLFFGEEHPPRRFSA